MGLLMLASVRKLSACLGLTGNPITVRALIGPAAPPLSLRARLSQVLQQQVDLNVIQVGSELFSSDDVWEIAFAIERTRTLFATVDLGIGTVKSYEISVAEALGHEHIDSNSEAEVVWQTWGFPGAAIDIFAVKNYAGPVVGRGPTKGPCKRDGDLHGGLVLAIEHIASITANTLAHELGHYLGLWHEGDPANLMFKDVPNGGTLTARQGEKMKQHCIVYWGCRQP